MSQKHQWPCPNIVVKYTCITWVMAIANGLGLSPPKSTSKILGFQRFLNNAPTPRSQVSEAPKIFEDVNQHTHQIHPWRWTAGTCPKMEVWFRSFSFLSMDDGCRWTMPLIFQGVSFQGFPILILANSVKSANSSPSPMKQALEWRWYFFPHGKKLSQIRRLH